MRDFKKYEIWKLSHKLILDVYELTSNFTKQEIFGLTSQIRRSSSSIPTNIPEGCGRDSDAESNRFLTITLGSANETEYLLMLSKDLNYITEDKSNLLLKDINLIKRKTYQLKQKLIA